MDTITLDLSKAASTKDIYEHLDGVLDCLMFSRYMSDEHRIDEVWEELEDHYEWFKIHFPPGINMADKIALQVLMRR